MTLSPFLANPLYLSLLLGLVVGFGISMFTLFIQLSASPKVLPTNLKTSKTNTPNASATPELIAINATLPQTQCGRCGYAGCNAYAQALLKGTINNNPVPTNLCAPGGDLTAARLSAMFDTPKAPINPATLSGFVDGIAMIDETTCIGCTLCIAVCPTDAIIGSLNARHRVVQELCTGCDLCVAACPVDCIQMSAVTDGLNVDPTQFRYDFERREQRRIRKTENRFKAKQSDHTRPVDHRTKLNQAIPNPETSRLANLTKLQHKALQEAITREENRANPDRASLEKMRQKLM